MGNHERATDGLGPLRRCVGCAEIMTLSAFYTSPTAKNFRSNECKKCTRARSARNKAAADPERRRQREREAHRLRAYGLGPAEFAALMSAQGGCCALCRRPFGPRKNSGPHVDHDHETGRVRGLLHGSCNVLLGHADDDVSVLQAAIAYLERAS